MVKIRVQRFDIYNFEQSIRQLSKFPYHQQKGESENADQSGGKGKSNSKGKSDSNGRSDSKGKTAGKGKQ